MPTLHSFFRSWYGDTKLFVLFAAFSSFLVTFYTTSHSLASSITLERHLVMFCFSFLLLLLAMVPIGYTVYRLDMNTYLGKHELLRYLLQFVVLVLFLSAIALRVVYKVYFVVFGTDLQKTQYFERDFVVVMFCLIMVQMYYVIRKERNMRNFGIRRRQVMQERLIQEKQVIAELHLAIEEQRLRYENELADIRGRKQRLRACHDQLTINEKRIKACLREATDQIEVMIGVANEWVRIPQVAYFHLKEGSARSKLVDVKLLDGREGTVDMDSLVKLEKRWPYLLFRAGRGLLIQHLAIKDQYKDNGEYIVELYGVHSERHKLAAEVYEKLLKIKDDWREVIPG